MHYWLHCRRYGSITYNIIMIIITDKSVLPLRPRQHAAVALMLLDLHEDESGPSVSDDNLRPPTVNEPQPPHRVGVHSRAPSAKVPVYTTLLFSSLLFLHPPKFFLRLRFIFKVWIRSRKQRFCFAQSPRSFRTRFQKHAFGENWGVKLLCSSTANRLFLNLNWL